MKRINWKRIDWAVVIIIVWGLLVLGIGTYKGIKNNKRIEVIKNYGFLYHDRSIMVCSSLDTVSLRGVVGVVDMDKLDKILQINNKGEGK